jgi:hypothetical protein
MVAASLKAGIKIESFMSSSTVRRALATAGLACLYFVLAWLGYWPASPLASRQLPGCACGDPVQQTWFLAWLPFALGHGQNVFFTSYLHVPAGANLAIDTAMPLLGLLGAPVTVTLGPVATYNLLLRCAFALSGASMFWVLRRYARWWAAALGSLAFAFSPYMIGQAHRHLFLVFVPLVPMFIPLIDDWLVRRSRPAVRSGLLLGLAAGLQYLISAEVLLASAILTVAGLAFLAVTHPARVADRLGALVKGLAAALAVFAVIAGYPVWMLLAGPGRPARGPLHPLADLARYHGDLLAPVVPTSKQLIMLGSWTRIGDTLVAGSTIENGFYLGIPLILLLAFLVIRYWRMPLVAVMTVIALIAFVLSLGSTLTLRGRAVAAPMPFALFTHLPFVQNIEPARFSLFVQLAAAVILATGLDRLAGVSRAAARQAGVALLGAAALVLLVPAAPLTSQPTRVPAFFTSQRLRLVPAGAVALTYPFDRAPRNHPMLWQAVSGIRFKIFGGDVFTRGRDGGSTWKLYPPGAHGIRAVLLYGTPPGRHAPRLSSAQKVAAIRQFCLRYRVAVALVDPSGPGRTTAALIERALRARPVRTGGIDVWPAVQRDLRYST